MRNSKRLVPWHVKPWFVALALMATAMGTAQAVPVSHEYLGLTVVGNLELAANKTLKDHGAVVLVHDALAHHTDAAMTKLQTALAGKGLNSVAISLSLGMNQRKAAFDCAHEHDHRHGDASDEIVAWVEWLQGQGAARVSIVGHGRGAAQAALSAAERQDLGINGLVLANPPRTTPQLTGARYQQQFGQPLTPVLEQARKLVEDGEGDTLLAVPGFLTCSKARTTAAAFVDYYGGDNRQDIVALLPELKLPTLVVVAGRDLAAQEFEKTLSLFTATGKVVQQTVTGADGGFTGNSGEQLADLVVKFVGGN
jgi:pimeloyl-ACP methyl ester carboxylesterase